MENRIIKFRAWDIKNKEMVGVRTIDWNDGGVIEEVDTKTYCWSDRFSPPTLSGVVIMQYTGLLDAKGKEIYEGDIVSWNSWGSGNEGSWKTAPMTWDEKECGFRLNGNSFSPSIYERIEVIGNIYENPELLK